MKSYMIKDTAVAYAKWGDDLYYFGITSAANINKTVNQEPIRGGLGNPVVAVLSTDNEYDFSITTALHYNEVYEIQTGKKFESVEDAKVTKVTVDGDTITADEETVAGEVLDLDADSFPKNMYIQLHTYVYDPETMEIQADLYYQFPKSLPNGELSEAFEAANKTSEIGFTPQVSDGSYGKIIVVPRNGNEEE